MGHKIDTKNSIRRRKSSASTSYCKKTKATNRNKTVQAKKQEKTALNTIEINAFLGKSDNFLGTFSSDQLHKLIVKTFPCFLIVNTAPINKSFGHWIAIRIGKNSLEIFDSLGGDPKKWGTNSLELLNFLQFYGRRKMIYVSPILQTSYSQLCGYFAVYFILARKFLSFSQILEPFSSDLLLNESIICDLLSTVF